MQYTLRCEIQKHSFFENVFWEGMYSNFKFLILMAKTISGGVLVGGSHEYLINNTDPTTTVGILQLW